MANFMYRGELLRLIGGGNAVDYSGDDIRVLLLMTNTTADTATTASVLSDITLDDFDGSGYASVMDYANGASAIQGEATAVNGANAEFDATDEDFSAAAISAGTRNIQGALVYRHKDGTAGNDEAICWIDTGGFGFAANGSTITIQWSTNGIIQAQPS